MKKKYQKPEVEVIVLDLKDELASGQTDRSTIENPWLTAVEEEPERMTSPNGN